MLNLDKRQYLGSGNTKLSSGNATGSAGNTRRSIGNTKATLQSSKLPARPLFRISESCFRCSGASTVNKVQQYSRVLSRESPLKGNHYRGRSMYHSLSTRKTNCLLSGKQRAKLSKVSAWQNKLGSPSSPAPIQSTLSPP